MEIFAFVLEGAPDLWIDGHLHRLAEGDGVTFQAGTGIAHSFINNSGADVRIFVMSEPFLRNGRVVHALDDAANANMRKMNMLWEGAPKRKLGPNRGKPGDLSGKKRGKPEYVVHWRDIVEKKPNRYNDSDEDQTHPRAVRAPGREFSRIGIHLDLLKPGRRTKLAACRAR